METELLWGATLLKLAPNLTWRNGNPETDIDLFGFAIPNTKPVICLKKDGDNAPCLPLTHPTGGFSIATPPEAFGPYLKHRLGWFYRMYVVHDGQVYSGREWIDDPLSIQNILQIQNVTLPAIVGWIKEQRSQNDDSIIYSDRFNNRFYPWNMGQRTPLAKAVT